MVDLGLFEGNPVSSTATNSGGGVVGDSFDGFHSSSFFWTSTDGFVSLPQTGANDVVALAINDSNKVVGHRSGGLKGRRVYLGSQNGIVRSLRFLPGFVACYFIGVEFTAAPKRVALSAFSSRSS